MEKVCIMGLGYIGLPTAAVLASKGYSVHGVDVSREVVAAINSGEVLIYEPALSGLVKASIQSNKLHASLVPDHADIYIIAVPTPFKENYEPDLSFIENAVKAIAPYVQKGNMIILESTSPIGTTEKIAAWLAKLRPDLHTPSFRQSESIDDTDGQVLIAHCPERVLPGNIINEIVTNDRIVGGIDSHSTQKTKEFYQQFVQGNVIATDARTAEMAKLTENSFRDVNIAFANELSIICDRLGINVWELIKLANRHPRVNILQPGPGVGGHCIAVDPWFIVHSAPEESKLIHMARLVNDYKPKHVIDKIIEKAERYKNPVIACLGLSFKANIDDLRESPAMNIVEQLAEKINNTILVVEPYIKNLPENLVKHSNLTFAKFQEAIEKADIIVLLVDHRFFENIDLKALKEKVIIDTRGMWE